MKLMDLFEFMPKSKFSASYGSDKGNYPFFTSSNTIDKYCDDFIYDGEFLIIGDGGTGNCKHYNGKFSVSDHNYVLKPKSQTNALAVKYFLEKDNYQILNDGFKGIGIKNVSKSYIQNIDYKYNQHFSQNEIVKNLVLIEKNIEREKQSINSLDCLIKSRFNEMFGDIISNKNQWQTDIFSKICDIRDGTHDSPKYVNNGYLFITAKNITNGELNFENSKLISKQDFDKIEKRSHVDNGDILMPMIGTIGGAIIVKKDRDFAIKNVCLIKFKKESLVINTYILFLLNSNEMNEHLNLIKKGGIQSFVGLSTIREINIPIPPLYKQFEFASFVEQIDKLKFNCQQRIKLYQELLDKKMDEYFG